MKETEYVVSYVTSMQITEDSFKRITPSLKVTGVVEFTVNTLQTL